MGEPIDPNSFLTRPGFIDGYHISRLWRCQIEFPTFRAKLVLTKEAMVSPTCLGPRRMLAPDPLLLRKGNVSAELSTDPV